MSKDFVKFLQTSGLLVRRRYPGFAGYIKVSHQSSLYRSIII